MNSPQFRCPCSICEARRAKRLQDDLNAMADRRVVTIRSPNVHKTGRLLEGSGD